MEQLIGTSTPAWKDAHKVADIKELIDQGVLLNWREMRRFKKLFRLEDELSIVRHFALRIAERTDDRLPEEILIESLLIWLSHSTDERLIHAMLSELLQQPGYAPACMTLVELAITTEISDVEHQEELFSMAVALICELGIMVRTQSETDEGFHDSGKILAHISTYLLSVSNTSNNCIRLSLLHYFGAVEINERHKNGFNRIMGRFGHTVLEHLFTLLFSKRTEAIALQFLLENVPYILDADNHSQKILHETWKYYMLKKPERFALFVQALSTHVGSLEEGPHNSYRRVLLQHWAMLFKVAGEVNHWDLGRSLLTAIMSFQGFEYRDQVIQTMTRDTSVRTSFRDQIDKFVESALPGVPVVENQFKSGKRGRKPSLSKTAEHGILYQINFLGNQNIARAS